MNSDYPDIGREQSLNLYFGFGLSPADPVSYMTFSWETNFDPSQMYVELWREKRDGTQQLLWSQKQAGVQFGSEQLLYDDYVEGHYYYRVNVVPEPSSALVLLTGATALLPFLKRARR